MCAKCRANGAITMSRLIVAGLATIPEATFNEGLHRDADFGSTVEWSTLAGLLALGYPEKGDGTGERMNREHVEEMAQRLTELHPADIAALFKLFQNLAILTSDLSQALANWLGRCADEEGKAGVMAKTLLLQLSALPRMASCTIDRDHIEELVMDWGGFEKVDNDEDEEEEGETEADAPKLTPTFPVARSRRGGLVS